MPFWGIIGIATDIPADMGSYPTGTCIAADVVVVVDAGCGGGGGGGGSGGGGMDCCGGIICPGCIGAMEKENPGAEYVQQDMPELQSCA